MLACSLFAWIPLLNILLIIAIFVLWVFIALDIAANFGQGTGFAILLIIFPWHHVPHPGLRQRAVQPDRAPGSAGFGAPPMPASAGYTRGPAGYAVPPAPAGSAGAAAAPPAAPVTPDSGPPLR